MNPLERIRHHASRSVGPAKSELNAAADAIETRMAQVHQFHIDEASGIQVSLESRDPKGVEPNRYAVDIGSDLWYYPPVDDWRSVFTPGINREDFLMDLETAMEKAAVMLTRLQA